MTAAPPPSRPPRKRRSTALDDAALRIFWNPEEGTPILTRERRRGDATDARDLPDPGPLVPPAAPGTWWDVRVTGRTEVDAAGLRRKLGARAWALWSLLLSRRSIEAGVGVSYARICRVLRCHRSTVGRAFARLFEAGLVKLAETPAVTPAGLRYPGSSNWWLVHGKHAPAAPLPPPPGAPPPPVVVRQETALWMQGAKDSRGGRRRGAGSRVAQEVEVANVLRVLSELGVSARAYLIATGRTVAAPSTAGADAAGQAAPMTRIKTPASRADNAGQSATYLKSISVLLSESVSAPSGGTGGADAPPASQTQNVTHEGSDASPPSPPWDAPVVPLAPEPPPAPLAAPCSPDEGPEPPPAPPPSPGTSSGPPRAPLPLDLLDDLLGPLPSATTPRVPEDADMPLGWVLPRGAPRYVPLSVLCPNARVPAPPRLNPADPLERSAYLLAAAYQGAVEHVLGVRSFVFRGQHPSKSSHWSRLLAAVPDVLAADVAPAAWAAWSCATWRDYPPSVRPGKGHAPAPGVGWVFSRKRLVDRGAWFRDDYRAENYRTAFMTPAMQDYRDRMGRYLLDATHERPRTAEAAQAIFARHFPGDLFDRLTTAAARDAVMQTSSLDRQAKNGEWVWQIDSMEPPWAKLL